jgi:N-acetylmuramoyl-L-alanine amidase
MNTIFAMIDNYIRSKLIKNIALIRFLNVLLAVLLFSGQFTSANSFNDSPYRIKTIVVDAGHGGHDGATKGLFSREKDIALQVALRLGKAIEENIKDVKVIYTRTSDVFVPLYERIGVANRNKADLFISIHCNSMPITVQSTSTKGVETFVSGFGRLDEQDVVMRENESILLEKDYKDNYEGYDPKDPESIILLSLMKNAFREQSIKLASFMQDEYILNGRIDRGVKEQSLAVLAKAGMPAVLTEIGFVSNPEEEEYMNSEIGQAEIVGSLLKAIQTYKKQAELE